MLRNSSEWRGFVLRATDGEIGHVEEFYFDDERWTIRYVVVDTGAWLTGYRIHAIGGEIGHVADFIVEDQTWAIRYVGVETGSWWPGKKVLISPEWIERVSWADATIDVSLKRETIKDAPEWDPGTPITRE